MTARPLSTTEPTESPIAPRDVREMALFLVRIFGEQAGDVAAERALKSEQGEEWRRVGLEVEKVLVDETARADQRSLRLFI